MKYSFSSNSYFPGLQSIEHYQCHYKDQLMTFSDILHVERHVIYSYILGPVFPVGLLYRIKVNLLLSSMFLHWFSITASAVPKHVLKGLSHEIDFKNFAKNLQNLA
jgi:hypothetical protein